MNFYAPDCEMVVGEGRPLDFEPSYHGREGVLRMFELARQSIVLSYRLCEILDAGGPCFAAKVEGRAIGNTSGVEVPMPVTHIYTLRDGQVTHQEQVWNWEDGPAALLAAIEAAD